MSDQSGPNPEDSDSEVIDLVLLTHNLEDAAADRESLIPGSLVDFLADPD